MFVCLFVMFCSAEQLVQKTAAKRIFHENLEAAYTLLAEKTGETGGVLFDDVKLTFSDLVLRYQRRGDLHAIFTAATHHETSHLPASLKEPFLYLIRLAFLDEKAAVRSVSSDARSISKNSRYDILKSVDQAPESISRHLFLEMFDVIFVQHRSIEASSALASIATSGFSLLKYKLWLSMMLKDIEQQRKHLMRPDYVLAALIKRKSFDAGCDVLFFLLSLIFLLKLIPRVMFQVITYLALTETCLRIAVKGPRK